MSDEGREVLLAAGRAAVARLQVALDAGVEEVVRLVEEETGERILVRRPGILDATFQDLAVMEEQAQHYAEAMALVRQWMVPSEARSLGMLLKVIPAQVAHEIMDHLRAARVLADGGGRLSP